MPADKNATPKIVSLSGALLVDRAQPLKDELLAALSDSGQVLVSLSAVEELDLACLQVLYGARRLAVADGKEFHFVGSVPARVAKRLAAAGFIPRTVERAEDLEATLADFN